MTQRNRIKLTAATRTPRGTQKVSHSTSVKNQARDQELEVVPVSRNDTSVRLKPDKTMEVYVSCVYHPNSFWIQGKTRFVFFVIVNCKDWLNHF